MNDLKILALDTSTEVMSIAVCGGGRVWSHSGPGGAQSSATLIPAVLQLLADAGLTLAGLDAIAFGQGPGSFTGLRTACSVAQGLGFGAGVRLLPVPTLMAVAEDARHRHGCTQVVALLDARMDEVYVAHYDFESAVRPLHAHYSVISPEKVQAGAPWALAGNAFAAYGPRLPQGVVCHEALPTAEALLRLAPGLLAAGQAVLPDQALPLYIRDKVAQTTEERMAARAAAA
jgi:tRNA threonylcarbamoyladenosine biosynthesis protein TsaB